MLGCPGLVVNGTVLQVTDEEIIVNVGYKSDGIVPIDEIYLESEQKPSDLYKEGDQIEVTVKSISSESVILSQKAVIQKKVWKEIEEAYKSGAEIEGIGSEVIKGGLIAKIKGISAFVPASQVSIRYVEDLSAFVGERLRLKVLEIDKQRNRVVASQKAILLAEEAERKRKFWDNIAEGQKITGEVKRLANFGAFVDIGGVDGLIHVSDLAWGHVHHPRDVVKEGQQVEVIVLSVDRERERVSLGYKQTLPHPWDNIEQKYPIGSIAEGKVVRITSFGAFIELESGVDGLVHISQVADRHISKVEDVLNIGDMVRVKILNVKPEEKRISLSIREAGPEEVEPPTPEDSESDNEYVKNEMTVVLGEFFPDELMEDK
jgi:small subunit ribosomal protein S1